jgi:hypothetical protein
MIEPLQKRFYKLYGKDGFRRCLNFYPTKAQTCLTADREHEVFLRKNTKTKSSLCPSCLCGKFFFVLPCLGQDERSERIQKVDIEDHEVQGFLNDKKSTTLKKPKKKLATNLVTIAYS